MASHKFRYTVARMIVGKRIKSRLALVGISQSELARRVGLTQPAINALIRGSSRTSLHLHRIARELGTTPAYLEGATEDPDENAPPPLPAPIVQHVMMPVVLPSERALARMFEALLRAMPDSASLDEQAQLLARRLPIGLSQLRDLLPEESAADRPMGKEQEAALAMPDPALR